MEWLGFIVLIVFLCGIFYIVTHPQQPSEAWQEYERICYEPIWKVEYTPIIEPQSIKVPEPTIDYEVIRSDYPTHWYN